MLLIGVGVTSLVRAGLGPGTERDRLVRDMFDRVAGRYELLNTVMTVGLYKLWNRRALRATGLCPGDRALDLACGTGSLTRKLAEAIGPSGSVLGVDFSPEMLRAAEARSKANVEYWLGDATDLAGIPDAGFDAVTIAYGARNISDLDALFAEMNRVLKPGGRAVCLEIARPSGRIFGTFYGLWFDRLVPKVGGWISGDPHAYSYLPESVKAFVAPDELAVVMERNGLQNVTWRRLVGSIITLHCGTGCPVGPR